MLAENPADIFGPLFGDAVNVQGFGSQAGEFPQKELH
jgi:hypothetical protein